MKKILINTTMLFASTAITNPIDLTFHNSPT